MGNWLDNYGKAENPNDTKLSFPKGFVGDGYSNKGRNFSPAWGGPYKNGGVVKDDMGYWNPDNWGEVVEIDSNEITMEGVNQPLLGISDTGDTKLMEPGKNYKFKGNKVTEYPLAKNGKNIKNNNWLDKYN